MNIISIFLGPSVILLQPHVGGFHASDFVFLPTFWQCLALIEFGHQGCISSCGARSVVWPDFF